jgi:large subunit ribosomal protein L6
MATTAEKGEGVNFSIPIPEDVNVSITGRMVNVKGPKGVLERELWHPSIHISLEQKEAGKEVIIKSDSARKKVRAIAGTCTAHIRNMITGVTDGFFYKLKAVHAHFPMQISLTKEGNAISISNFLGERKPRISKIVEGVKVEIKGREIIISGIDKEAVGQTAANIEQKTKIKVYDPRVFQDGIYLIEKGVGF